MNNSNSYQIAVLIPCYNEELTIAPVVKSFKEILPAAKIYVYDNASTDKTAQHAATAGAKVVKEERRGKGNVVRRMFADVEADIYILVDGDNTYDASISKIMVEKLISQELDMVIAKREVPPHEHNAYRQGHEWGNKLFNLLLRLCFGNYFTDIFSGYRVLSRRYVKSLPIMAGGFEIETEMSVHCLELNIPVAEIPCRYISRPAGSVSKLSSYKDGFRILKLMLNLMQNFRPLLFFGSISLILMMVALFLAWPLFTTYLATGLVPRLPTGVLVVGLGIVAFTSFTCGVLLSNLASARREFKYLAYLALPRFSRGSTASNLSSVSSEGNIL